MSKLKKYTRDDKKMLKKMVRKFGKNFAALALAVGVISTSQVCHFFLNQPEVPDQMKKLVDKRKK